MEQRRMLTVKQVAERLQIGQVTVLRWLRSGKLRGVKPGGTRIGWRIPVAELEGLEAGGWVPRAEAERIVLDMMTPSPPKRAATAERRSADDGLATALAQVEQARARGDDADVERWTQIVAALVARQEGREA